MLSLSIPNWKTFVELFLVMLMKQICAFSNSLKEEIELELVQGLVKDDGREMLLYLFDNEQIGALGFGKWVTFLWLPFLERCFLGRGCWK
jgi:hypothetical protein